MSTLLPGEVGGGVTSDTDGEGDENRALSTREAGRMQVPDTRLPFLFLP